MGEYIHVATKEGETGGRLTLPETSAPVPVVIIMPAIAGLNDYIDEVARNLAEQGFASFALDYFAREGGPPDLSSRDKIQSAVASVSDPRTMDDLEAVIQHLESDDRLDMRRLAILGFCMGGSYALLAASRFNRFNCVIAFYGTLVYQNLTENKPVSPLDAAEKVTCPVLGHFGEVDPWIPLEHVEELKKRLANRPAEIYIYPGAGHAFHEHFRPDIYRPVAAREAWQRTLIYLKQYC